MSGRWLCAAAVLAFASCRNEVAAVADPQAIAFTATPWPEADRLFHRDPRWLGADAAFSVPLGEGRVLWLFGDTFIATSEHGVRRESRMVRNSIAVQRGLDPSAAEITFHWKDDPASWLPEEGERWFWPLHGIRVPGGPLVLFWSRLHRSSEGLGFEADGWTAVIVDEPDREPDAWRPRTLACPPFPRGILPAQGLCLDGDFAVGLAIREPGDHAGYALRIPIAALRDGDLSALELWHGAWSRASADSKPVAVLADAAPECSVSFERAWNRWVHVRSLGFGATTLGVATSERFTGPWSEPVPVFRPPESDRPRTLVYAGKAHPELLGAELVVTYASNSPDFATLVGDASLYYPRFVRIDRRSR